MKRAAATTAVGEPEAKAAAVPPAEDRPDAEILAELGLPDPDDLEPGSDFSAFMAKAVPNRIRNRALRRLWLSNPVLANLDGLVDYGDDFTDSATVIENVQTAYQVGKGFVERIADMAEEPDSAPEEGAETGADAAPEAAAGDAADPDVAASSGEDDAPEAIAHAEPMRVVAPSRRMRFRLMEE